MVGAVLTTLDGAVGLDDPPPLPPQARTVTVTTTV